MMLRRLLRIACCAWILVVAAIADAATADHAAAPVATAAPASDDPSPCRGCNLVVIVLDAARASNFGCYGYTRDTTPRIDELASEAVVFAHAQAEASYTIPSIASLFSGLRPARHKVVSTDAALAPAVETLAEVCERHGYRTGAFSENPLIRPSLGYGQGFQRFEAFAEPSDEHSTDFDLTAARQHVRTMLDWVAEQDRDIPFFLYAHILRPHNPYAPLPEYADTFAKHDPGALRGTTKELLAIQFGALSPSAQDVRQLRDLYDENLKSADALVGQLLDGLRADGRLDRSMVVLVADHGEELLEHGKVLHGPQVYQESIHVPFLIRMPPGRGFAPGRRQTIVQLRDVMPTVAAAFGFETRGPLSGMNLVPVLRSPEPTPPRALVSRSMPDFSTFALREDALKYVEKRVPIGPPQGLLFDLADDPLERRDVASSMPAERDRLAERLHAVVDGHHPDDLAAAPAPPGEAMGAMLRALGYAE